MQNNNILKSARSNTEKIIEWLLCPVCNSKTRIKIRSDTILKNFPLSKSQTHRRGADNKQNF